MMEGEKMNNDQKVKGVGSAISSSSSSNQSNLSCNGGGRRSRSGSRSRSSSFSKPSWLLSAVSDLDEKMKAVALNPNKTPTEEDKSGDSFAQRAESYYQKRPQLLSLLKDLYNGYLSLADRYCHLRRRRQALAANSDDKVDDSCSEPEQSDGEFTESDVESSLSYQPPLNLTPTLDADAIVAELVIKMVDYDIVVEELSLEEKRWNESSRKIELQKSLLDVLESERLILLNENARLGYRVAALAEENKGLAAETMFMKRKAGELARCVLEMREDHRVCMLSRKIEDLQGQIYGLEKRNKDYYQQLVKKEDSNLLMKTPARTQKGIRSKFNKMRKKSRGEVTLEDCFQVDEEEETGGKGSGGGGGGGGKRVSRMWDKVRKFDLFPCGAQPRFKFP